MEELLPKIPSWFEFLSVHKELLQDKVRIQAYSSAIKEIVKEGSVVADIGTGTGLLAFLAVRAGAKRVYAIECVNIIRLAEEVAKRNDLSEKIIFIKEDSRYVTLPEKVDLVVSEVLGHCVLDENMLDSIIDARQRFLKKKGSMIPQRVTMIFAPISDNKTFKDMNFWKQEIMGIDFSPAWNKFVNNVYINNFSRDKFLADPKILANIDLRYVSKIDLSGNQDFLVIKDGILHGFAGWFEATLSIEDEIVLRTGPDDPRSHWGCAFFPLENSIEVTEGQYITFDFNCYSTSGTVTWEWNTSVYEKGKIRHYSHSTALY